MSEPNLVQIVPYRGSRQELRPLFEIAEDSSQELDSYLDDGVVFVAYADDVPIGHLQLVTADHGAEIKNMAVVQEYRRHGVGRVLVAQAIEISRSEGYRQLLVRTGAADIGNLRFYQRLGFRFLAVERDAFTAANGYPAGLEIDGIPLRDAVLLSQELSPSEPRSPNR
jgi:GNAT superfamily N-acetyltransferase